MFIYIIIDVFSESITLIFVSHLTNSVHDFSQRCWLARVVS